MESRGLQKSQFRNSLVNWEKCESTTKSFIIKKTIQIFDLSHELGKIQLHQHSKIPKFLCEFGKT